MKFRSTIVSLLIPLGWASAQTNTFPPDGSAGIGTTTPSTYLHGGNNKALQVHNPNTTMHSQSHLILSTAGILPGSSAGTVTWITTGATGQRGLAYIGSLLTMGANGNATGNLIFATGNEVAINQHMVLDKFGNLGIGTLTPDSRLTVNGVISSKEVKVVAQGWPDYVFTKDYNLIPLEKVDSLVNRLGHLPDFPSALEVENEGIKLGEMNAKLLKKIEELTLYLIDQNNKIKILEATLSRNGLK